jgi:hypothetical protein
VLSSSHLLSASLENPPSSDSMQFLDLIQALSLCVLRG